jgi:formate hydrogenlyase subunit 6/NADH:ubiquinone oxidoreductase subunit I
MDFIVYSGTGNTYRVAAWMAEVARAAGHATTLQVVSDRDGGARATPTGTGMLVLASPTHGFTAPLGALRAAWGLPSGGGIPQGRRDAAVVATRGSMRIGKLYLPGFEGSATLLLALLLWLKGYRIVGVAAIDMPSNWSSVHSALPEDAVAHLEARARARARIEMQRWLSHRRPLPWLTFAGGLLLLPATLMYQLAGRSVLGKSYFTSPACTGCGLCARACPHGAIRMRAQPGGVLRPYWSFRCESCMRCMAYCPEAAIEVNQVLAASVTALSMALPKPKRGRWGRHVLTVADSAVALMALALIYPVLQRLLGKVPVNRLAMATTLTRRWRRYHEPETALRALLPPLRRQAKALSHDDTHA